MCACIYSIQLIPQFISLRLFLLSVLYCFAENVNFSPPQWSVEYWTEYPKRHKIIIFTQLVIQQKLSFPSQNIRCHHDNLLWQTLSLARLAQISVRCWSEWIQLGFLIHSVVFGKQWFVQSQTEIILYIGGEGMDYPKSIMTPHCEHVMATGIYLRELFWCIYPGFVFEIKRLSGCRGKSVDYCGKKWGGYPTGELTFCLTDSSIKPNVYFHLSSFMSISKMKAIIRTWNVAAKKCS